MTTTAPQGTAARRSAARDSSTHVADHGKGNLYGILFMQLAMLCFVTTDTLSKLAGSSMPVSELTVVRGIFGTVAVLGICVLTREIRHWKQALYPTVLIRASLEAAASLSFLFALTHMPLGNVTAILLAIPLATTAGAALFFGERVGIRRFSAIMVGFVGVLAIVRPGLEGFDSFALYAIGAMLLASARDLVTRKMPAGISVWVVTTVTTIMVGLVGAVWGLTEEWVPLTTTSTLYLVGAAIVLLFGHFFIVIAMRNGDMSVVSSFRYSSILLAILLGYFIWGDIPDLMTWLGIGLILASGLYTIFRERRLAMQRSKS